MIVRKFVTALAAVALAASGPVAASAAQPLSVANSPEMRAAAGVEDANDLEGVGTIWLIVGAVVLYLGIAAIADWWPFDDDDPDSP
jgi:hypothetical protein